MQENNQRVIMTLMAVFSHRGTICQKEKTCHLNHVDPSPQVSEIQSRSAQMEVQNNYLDTDLKQCVHTRKEAAAEAANQLQHKQKSHDEQVEYGPAVIHTCVCCIQ